MKNNTKRGFTIIEMVIVIAIIGILAAVLIPTYGNVVGKANESAALQSARSTMTNWLASSTTSAGVPTSGKDVNGNEYYAAYFEFVNGETDAVYQYRYEDGGLKRTDNNELWYVNFGAKDRAEKVFLTTPNVDKNFDLEKYAVNIYKLSVTDAGNEKTSTNYYIKEGAAGAYSCGGADVYAGTNAKQVFYKLEKGNEKDVKGVNSWVANETGVYGFAGGDITKLDETNTAENAPVAFKKYAVGDYKEWTTGAASATP